MSLNKEVKKPCVLILGCGYVGRMFMAEAARLGFVVIPVSRSPARIDDWHKLNYHSLLLQGTVSALRDPILQQVTVIIDSIPLDQSYGMRASQQDWSADVLGQCPKVQQLIYLSSTSVYGHADGAWVNEAWSCQPSSVRGKERLKAEQAWRDAMKNIQQEATIFRLAGIYGAKRNIYARLKKGDYHAIRWQPEHISNRIHVADIVQALLAAIGKQATGIFNISDDTPTPHADYVLTLAQHLNAPTPTILSPEEGAQHLSPAKLSFFQDSKCIDNTRMHDELLPVLRYPSFLHALNGSA